MNQRRTVLVIYFFLVGSSLSSSLAPFLVYILRSWIAVIGKNVPSR